MENEYYDLTADLDAREILRYLNDLGIYNISGEVLKCFITDLKKYIKYDLQKENNKKTIADDLPGPERLHSASTFCSRSRSKTYEGKNLQCTRECFKPRGILSARHIQSAPNLGPKPGEEEKPLRRACSCIRVERKIDAVPTTSKTTVTQSSVNSNIIKVAKQPAKKKCDPVTLYHFYTSLWAKYKPNVPGENNWSELRWNVRQRMAGMEIETKVMENNTRKAKEKNAVKVSPRDQV